VRAKDGRVSLIGFPVFSQQLLVVPKALTEVLRHTKHSATVEKYGDRLDVEFVKEELQKVD